MRAQWILPLILALAGCAEPPLRPVPIAGTAPPSSVLQQDSQAAVSRYAGPAPVTPWLPLEPTPGLRNPAPEPFSGFHGPRF